MFEELGSLDGYQNNVEQYAPDIAESSVPAVAWAAMALTGEAGEVAEKVKKIYRDKDGQLTDDDRLAIAYELGDTLWCVSHMACVLGYNLRTIAALNKKKLASRAKRGTLCGEGDNR